MDTLIEGANSDIRQVLNMLSTWKLSHSDMDFDQGKQLCVFFRSVVWNPRAYIILELNDLTLITRARANQKHLIMTPYTILDKLLGPYTFSETSRETLNDKMDYYFQDHSFIPLFVQVGCCFNSLAPPESGSNVTACYRSFMTVGELCEDHASTYAKLFRRTRSRYEASRATR